MPATLQFLSDWLNGEMLVICTNSPEPVPFCRVVLRGSLIASPTEADTKLPAKQQFVSDGWSSRRVEN